MLIYNRNCGFKYILYFQYAQRARHKELKQQNFSKAVNEQKNFVEYSNEFKKIDKNCENRFLTRRLIDEKRELEIEETIRMVNKFKIHFPSLKVLHLLF